VGYQKPLPSPDPESTPFWEGCRREKLLIQRCRACGLHRFPPTDFCPGCRSHDTEWVEASGKGRVFSWIVVRHPVPKEVYAGEVPYVVAIVLLDEGVRMVSNLVDVDPEAVEADMPVEVRFRPATEEITLPVFAPATGAAGA